MAVFLGLSLLPGPYLSVTAAHCSSRHYTSYLTERLRRSGVVLQQARVTSVSEVSQYDVVVDCCGLESRELFNDPELHPIRGQVVRVHAPWVTQCYFNDPFYVIPNREFLVLGGTSQLGDGNTLVSVDDKERILRGCCELIPSLAAAEVVDDWVGLRPGRVKVRLETKEVPLEGGRRLPVVHNVGHGGSGLTLAWGCAGDVVHAVKAVAS